MALDKASVFVECLVNIMASDTRNRILSVAARLFEARGFEGTAVAAILREADVNSGSLYHFFSSKEDLLIAVLEKYAAVLEPALLSAADRAADDPIEKVFALLELYRGRLLVSEFSRGCPIGDLSLEIGARLPEARHLVDAYFDSWTARVTEWFDDAAERLPAETDRRALSAHVLSVLQGGIMQARVAGSIDPFDDSVSQLRLLIDLLAARPKGEVALRPRRRKSPRTDTPKVSDTSPPDDPSALAAASVPVDPVGAEVVDAGESAWWKAW
jgi:AcrR family transcriptional regulator